MSVKQSQGYLYRLSLFKKASGTIDVSGPIVTTSVDDERLCRRIPRIPC